MQPILKQNLAKRKKFIWYSKDFHASFTMLCYSLIVWNVLLIATRVEFCASIEAYRFIILLCNRFILGIKSTNRILFGRETLVYECETRYCFRRMHINLYMEYIRYWYKKDLFSCILEKLYLSRIINVEKSTLQTGRKYQIVHMLPKTFNLCNMFQ